MEYQILREGEEIYSGSLLPFVQMIPFLDGLVEQKMVAVGDTLKVLGSSVGSFKYAGDRRWKGTIGGASERATAPRAPGDTG